VLTSFEGVNRQLKVNDFWGIKEICIVVQLSRFQQSTSRIKRTSKDVVGNRNVNSHSNCYLPHYSCCGIRVTRATPDSWGVKSLSCVWYANPLKEQCRLSNDTLCAGIRARCSQRVCLLCTFARFACLFSCGRSAESFVFILRFRPCSYYCFNKDTPFSETTSVKMWTCTDICSKIWQWILCTPDSYD